MDKTTAPSAGQGRPAPGTPEYDQYMAQVAETGQVPDKPEDTPEAPDKVPEGSQQEKPEDTPEAPESQPEKPEDTPEAPESRPDFSKFSAEFTEKGELSAESYQELEGMGIPREMVDTYIAGQRYQAEQYQAAAYKEAGGSQESYTQMATWAKANASPQELAAYNEAVGSGDPEKMSQAVRGMYTKFTASVGSEPSTTVTDQGSRPATASAYASLDQYHDDLRNPKYKKSAAFRAEVMAKLQRSNI